MATTWADIKRLAADLQRVQLLEGTKKWDFLVFLYLSSILKHLNKYFVINTLVIFLDFLFRLSEKNCVEVVSILIGSKAVDLVFTVDGQHYITKKHLLTEIKNECLGNGIVLNWFLHKNFIWLPIFLCLEVVHAIEVIFR